MHALKLADVGLVYSVLDPFVYIISYWMSYTMRIKIDKILFMGSKHPTNTFTSSNISSKYLDNPKQWHQ